MTDEEIKRAQAAADVARELLKSMAAGSMTSATIKTGLKMIVNLLEGK